MPPELAAAVSKTMRSDSAADVWALGVMAYEILTGTTLFPPAASQDAAWKQLLGQAPLPWEPGCEGAAEKLGQLRALKRGVLACLASNPKDRPSSERVLTTWTHIFDSRTQTRTEFAQ